MLGFTEVLWVLLLLAVGVVAFVAIVLLGVARIVQGLLRGVYWLLRGPRRAPPSNAQPHRLLRACPQPQCGFLNAEGARFCARCGTPLESARVIDTHDE